MLEGLDLACRKGDRLLFKGVGFAVSKGEILWIEGSNGSGKTSLLRILCGLSAPETGTVRWQGHEARASDERFAADVLYLGHHNAVKDDLTVLENLGYIARLHGRPADRATLDAVLANCGLSDRRDLPVRVLSQGQRRRVGLARLWLPPAPTLWILDEPFAALDHRSVTRLADRLAAHLEAGGVAVLTTHQEVPLPNARVRRLRLDA